MSARACTASASDKCRCARQNRDMQISCPKCSVRYYVADVKPEDVLECHNCGSTFSIGEQIANAPDIGAPSEESASSLEMQPDESPLAEQKTEKHAQEPEADTPADQLSSVSAERAIEAPETSDQEAVESSMAAPQPRTGRIWPWMLLILLAIAGSGFWMNKDAWLDNTWMRSSLANLGLPMLVRDKDWRIVPGSVHATWVERDDGSRVMVIEGRLANLLSRTLPLPVIRVRFFAAENPSQPIHTLDAYITEPPLLDDIRHAPFKSPPKDALEVIDHGERDFVLVVENAPSKAGDFELRPIARQPGA